MFKIRLLCLVFVTLLCSENLLAEFDAGKSSFSVTVNNEIYPYREFATYVLPQEHLSICVNTTDSEQVELIADSCKLMHVDDCRWIWIAPDRIGLTSLKIINKANKDVIKLNVFVMTPRSKLKNGVLDSSSPGKYPEPIDSSPLYQKPDGFIKIDADMLNTPVSPHFVLGQFISPFDGHFPRYIVLKERLLLKLETLLERLNKQGYQIESLSIVAAYFSPKYNASVGGPAYSRHLYGGAATIIIDSDADGQMDDLNNDGLIDDRDGAILFNIIDQLYRETGKEYLRGGLFLHKKTDKRGPVIMIDARGYRKRWNNTEKTVPMLPDDLRPKHKRQFIK